MNSSMILLLLTGLALTKGAIQQFEFYSEPDQGGTFLTLRDKVYDLKDWKFFLANVKSYCVAGIWTFYANTHFHGRLKGSYFGDGGIAAAFEERRCANGSDFAQINSVRFRGPADTRTIAVSIYEGTIDNNVGGFELVVEGRAANNFPMNKTVVVGSHGRSSWTFFTENNFEGTSWCFPFDGRAYRSGQVNETHPIRSVIRDCDTQSVSQTIREYQMGTPN